VRGHVFYACTGRRAGTPRVNAPSFLVPGKGRTESHFTVRSPARPARVHGSGVSWSSSGSFAIVIIVIILRCGHSYTCACARALTVHRCAVVSGSKDFSILLCSHAYNKRIHTITDRDARAQPNRRYIIIITIITKIIMIMIIIIIIIMRVIT
jgi:hypothetical protein